MSKPAIKEDRVCHILKTQLYYMADNENQNTYEPLQLKWVLPIESTNGMISAFKNIIYLLDYVQKNGCNEDTIDKIIENDVRPITSELRDEYDFFMAGTIMAMCSTVDDFSDTKELMRLVREIIGKFIYMFEMAWKLLDSKDSTGSNDISLKEIDTSKLVIGMVMKNYKELCNLFGEEAKTGKAKQLQLKELEKIF